MADWRIFGQDRSMSAPGRSVMGGAVTTRPDPTTAEQTRASAFARLFRGPMDWLLRRRTTPAAANGWARGSLAPPRDAARGAATSESSATAPREAEIATFLSRIAELEQSRSADRTNTDQTLKALAADETATKKQLARQKDELEKLRRWLALMRKHRWLTAQPLLDYEDIAEWAQRELEPHAVIVHERAIKETAKRATFHDIVLFQQALLLLRDRYVPMRTNPADKRLRQAFADGCRELGLEEAQVLARLGDADYLDARYFVTHAGRRRLCDRHLKYGNACDPAISFRIYFFWDDGNRQLVIGHMPTHLNNWQTN